MSKLQPVRGTHDILPDEYDRFNAVVEAARDIALQHGYREMATPIFEMTEVFARSMGESSDVVSKEMFTFETKGGESVTLRPEFTAGIVRALLSNGMQQYLPLKLFSAGPVFRYERPQKGRQRQFHQVNCEWFGNPSPEADAELILMAARLLYYLSPGNHFTLLINSLGDIESRSSYREALVAYFTPLLAELSADSQRRLHQNPLRILDSKDEGDRVLLEKAPKLKDYLSAEAKARFDTVSAYLHHKALNLDNFTLKIEPTLVRGLDYYNHTVFEFMGEGGELGAQSTVLAGGRYDGLIEQMGGKPIPALGFAAGVERLLLVGRLGTQHKIPEINIVLLPLDDVDKAYVLHLANALRVRLFENLLDKRQKQLFTVEILWSGKLSARLEKANKKKMTHALVLGAKEILATQCKVKDLNTRQEKLFSLDMAQWTKEVLQGHFGMISDER